MIVLTIQTSNIDNVSMIVSNISGACVCPETEGICYASVPPLLKTETRRIQRDGSAYALLPLFKLEALQWASTTRPPRDSLKPVLKVRRGMHAAGPFTSFARKCIFMLFDRVCPSSGRVTLAPDIKFLRWKTMATAHGKREREKSVLNIVFETLHWKSERDPDTGARMLLYYFI